jgi:hypothetical protein
MPFRKLVGDPEAARVLNDALHEVCRAAGIALDGPDAQDAIAFVMRLYWLGHRTPEALKAAINQSVSKEWDH